MYLHPAGALSVFGVLLDPARGGTPANHPLTAALSRVATEEGTPPVDFDVELAQLLPRRRSNGRRPYIHYTGAGFRDPSPTPIPEEHVCAIELNYS